MNRNEHDAYVKKKADKMRYNLIAMLAYAGSGHPGGSLSVLDILSALFFGGVMKLSPHDPKWPDRDRLVLSKGHASPALYVILAELGYFPKEWLRTFDAPGSQLPKHCNRFSTPGIEVSTGALGQGISNAVGFALAERLDQEHHYDVYCIVSDGECQSGNLWEAVMSASKYRLDHLKVIVDNNRLQIDGLIEDIMPLGDMQKIWEGFGWHVEVCDGHNIEELIAVFNKLKTVKGKPQVIIANTVKGKGVSFMENDVNWHSDKISRDQARVALAELDTRLDPEIRPAADFLSPEDLDILRGNG